MIGENFPIFFEKFSNFSKSFRSFRSFGKFSKNRLRRDDSFGPKIVEVGAILAIFDRLKIFIGFRSLHSL